MNVFKKAFAVFFMIVLTDFAFAKDGSVISGSEDDPFRKTVWEYQNSQVISFFEDGTLICDSVKTSYKVKKNGNFYMATCRLGLTKFTFFIEDFYATSVNCKSVVCNCMLTKKEVKENSFIAMDCTKRYTNPYE
ncbi:MAG: hypothetical protein K6G00_06500 [Treponema sp.]|nr:hypothetical protein [Treponema sp.]